MMHSTTKISQLVPLHWSVILRWTTQGPRALLFKNIDEISGVFTKDKSGYAFTSIFKT